jgi:hypothetical protein
MKEILLSKLNPVDIDIFSQLFVKNMSYSEFVINEQTSTENILKEEDVSETKDHT